MNWKSEAIAKLRDYNARKTAVTHIPDELVELEARFTGIKASTSDTAPVKGGGNRREDALINNIVRRAELQESLAVAQRQLERVSAGLDVLSDEERHILDTFYVKRPYNHIERLIDELHISQSDVYRRKDAALRTFTLAMYGIVEL